MEDINRVVDLQQENKELRKEIQEKRLKEKQDYELLQKAKRLEKENRNLQLYLKHRSKIELGNKIGSSMKKVGLATGKVLKKLGIKLGTWLLAYGRFLKEKEREAQERAKNRPRRKK